MYDFTIGTQSNGLDWAVYGEFTEQSRHGSSCKLARTLVANGFEDGEVILWNNGTKSMIFPSLHELAKKTYSEGSCSVRMKTFTPFPHNTQETV